MIDEEAATASPPASTVQGWDNLRLPGKRATHYRETRQAGRVAIHARSERSVSMLRRHLNVPAHDLNELKFSWWVPALLASSDVRRREADDSPARVVLAFDGDESKLPTSELVKFDLAEVMTGERPPYATLMYVWERQAPLDAVVINTRSSRIRKLVVESGPRHLGQWRDYRRRIADDYRKAFGEDPGPLKAVGLMTDSDNTQDKAEAWYGEIEVQPRAAVSQWRGQTMVLKSPIKPG